MGGCRTDGLLVRLTSTHQRDTLCPSYAPTNGYFLGYQNNLTLPVQRILKHTTVGCHKSPMALRGLTKCNMCEQRFGIPCLCNAVLTWRYRRIMPVVWCWSTLFICKHKCLSLVFRPLQFYITSCSWNHFSVFWLKKCIVTIFKEWKNMQCVLTKK